MSKKIINKQSTGLSDKKLRELFAQDSVYVHCLIPLLSALNWKGTERELVEAAPYLAPYLDLGGLINMMNRLGFNVTRNVTNLRSFDHRLFPCLFIAADNKPYVLLKEEGGKILAFDPTANKPCHLEETSSKGRVFLFLPDKKTSISERSKTWFRDLIDHYRPLLLQILLLTLVQSLLMLAVPIFVMNVYDKVITTGSYSMLLGFVIGAVLSLSLLGILQYIRNYVLAYVGAQLDQRIGNAIVEKLLALPTIYTEHTSVSAQLAQVKNFDQVREFFSGSPLASLIDLPFLLIFIIVLAFFGKWLVLIPIVMFVLMLGITWFLRNFIFFRIKRAAAESADLQKFIIEMLTNLRLIKLLNGAKIWLQRYTDLAAKKAFANYQSALTYQVINIVADALMIMAGLAVLAFGALSVLHNVITVGALLASMILVWRILGPLKSTIVLFTQLDQIKVSIQQINNLMSLDDEDEQNTNRESIAIQGNITFSNVSLRFPGKTEAALSNISLQIPAGSLVGVTGRSGSGKSCLLKTLLNLYPLASGELFLDERNILQYAPDILRQSIAYVPQNNQFFYGTIKQNLLMRNPLATDERIEKILHKVGVWDYIKQLPDGVNTQIRDHKEKIPQSLLQRLNIARALMTRCKILLLDEVSDHLDNEGDKDFQNLLAKLRGKMTILMVTQRPSHLKLVDQLVVLNRGQLLAVGKPDDILDKLIEAYKDGKA